MQKEVPGTIEWYVRGLTSRDFWAHALTDSIPQIDLHIENPETEWTQEPKKYAYPRRAQGPGAEVWGNNLASLGLHKRKIYCTFRF
jgi:hypothetical protein